MDLHTPPSTKRQREEQHISTEANDHDRISKLPDDLILYILSFLRTKDCIPTGALSKRWKNMWKRVLKIKFSDKDIIYGSADHIRDTLLSYQNLSLYSLDISISYERDQMDLLLWLEIALAKNVSKLMLRLNQVGEPVTFPDSLLRRAKTLKTLKLMGNIHLNLIFANVLLSSLKELHLYNVKFEDEYSVTRLLCGCPVLEDLVLDIHVISSVSFFVLNVPSLLRLTISTYNCEVDSIMIQTPCLKYLNIRNLHGVASCIMCNAPDILEATISSSPRDLDENILVAIASVQYLSLSAHPKTHRNTLFYALTSLKIDTEPDEWCSILSYMLINSPELKLLRLVGGKFKRNAVTWIEPKYVARCLLTSLKTIEWENYNWDGEDDTAVAVYLLKNARQLKNATFSTLDPGTNTLRQQKQSKLNRIANTERASSQCHLLLEVSSYPLSKLNS